jgi:hypothetical protein
LGTLFAKLRFVIANEAGLPALRSQAELGNESNFALPSQAELGNESNFALPSQAELGNESNFQFVLVATSLLAVIGLVGLIRDAVKPYKTPGDYDARRLAGAIAARAGPDDQVVVLNEDWRLPPGMEWYLRRYGVRISWNGELDTLRLAKSTQQLWVLEFAGSGHRWRNVEERLRQSPRAFTLVRQADYRFPFGWDLEHGDKCRLLYLVAAPSEPDPGVITAEGDARSTGSGLVPATLDKPP